MNLRWTILLLFLSRIAFANCELQWSVEWELGQNWTHTVAVYPEKNESKKFVSFKVIDGRIKYVCPSDFGEVSAEDLQQIDTGTPQLSKSCHLPRKIVTARSTCALDFKSTSIKMRKVDEYRPEETSFDVSVTSCQPILAGEEVLELRSSGEMFIPRSFKLSPKDAAAEFKTLEKEIRALPDLKTIGMGEVYDGKSHQSIKLKADFSKTNFAKMKIHANSEQPGIQFIDFVALVKMSEMPGACSPKCKNPNKAVEFPISVLKHDGKIRLFANGMVGACSGEAASTREVMEGREAGKPYVPPTLEQKYAMPFGIPEKYEVYDFDGDKTIDAFSLSPRKHKSGLREFYYFRGDKIVNGGGSCMASYGECQPAPGC